MSENKQTAVEMILSHLPLWMRNRLSENGVTAQALQMEREQIVIAAETQTEKSEISGEQYYTDTYGE